MSTRIYIACPLDRLGKAQSIASRLDAAGFDVVSTWHTIVKPGDVDPMDDEARARILDVNLRELESADLVVGYTAGGTPKATYGEIAYAIACKLPVVLGVVPSGRDGRFIFDAHPLITRFTSDEQMVETVQRVAAVVMAPADHVMESSHGR